MLLDKLSLHFVTIVMFQVNFLKSFPLLEEIFSEKRMFEKVMKKLMLGFQDWQRQTFECNKEYIYIFFNTIIRFFKFHCFLTIVYSNHSNNCITLQDNAFKIVSLLTLVTVKWGYLDLLLFPISHPIAFTKLLQTTA